MLKEDWVDLIGGPSVRQEERWKERWRKGVWGTKNLCLWPDDPETREARAHKNALSIPPATPYFYPSPFPSPCPLSQFSSLLHLRHGRLQLSDVTGGCQRSRQPYFVNSRVTNVNKAEWPSMCPHLSIFLLFPCVRAAHVNFCCWSNSVYLLKFCDMRCSYISNIIIILTNPSFYR